MSHLKDLINSRLFFRGITELKTCITVPDKGKEILKSQITIFSKSLLHTCYVMHAVHGIEMAKFH